MEASYVVTHWPLIKLEVGAWVATEEIATVAMAKRLANLETMVSKKLQFNGEREKEDVDESQEK